MIKKVLETFQKGNLILVFDDKNREKETDMIVAGQFITPQKIATMRNDAGGLLCTALSHDLADKMGLPFMTDVMAAASFKYPVLTELSPTDIPYDEKSAFSLTLNHRKTFTGITDNDRALTISELALLCKKEDYQNLGKYFRSPGHVTLLRAAEGLLLKRKGHTEISVALAEMTGLTQVASMCEMMDDTTGNSLSTDDVEKYASKNDLVFISGAEIIEAYKDFKGL
jgi:3,4-dihydroxy 2-butanone 4-phosphate synthase